MLLEFDSDTPQALCAHREVVHYQRHGVTTDSDMQLPCETPVALVYNGIAHSVMMCSAADLEDFAIGFSLSEGIIDGLHDIHDIEQVDGCQGIELHITLANRCVHRLKEKRRTLAGRTGCGICGSESLTQVVRTLPQLPDSQRFEVTLIDKVLAALRPLQLLGQSTGATHAAVHVDGEGNILAIREDVGRHIALDKLVGHLCRTGRRHSGNQPRQLRDGAKVRQCRCGNPARHLGRYRTRGRAGGAERAHPGGLLPPGPRRDLQRSSAYRAGVVQPWMPGYPIGGLRGPAGTRPLADGGRLGYSPAPTRLVRLGEEQPAPARGA